MEILRKMVIAHYNKSDLNIIMFQSHKNYLKLTQEAFYIHYSAK